METMNQLKVYKPNTGFCIGYGGQMADHPCADLVSFHRLQNLAQKFQIKADSQVLFQLSVEGDPLSPHCQATAPYFR